MTKVNSLLKYAQDFSASYDSRTVPDVAWVQNLVSSVGSALRLKGALDGSSGAITAPATGTVGDTYYVTGAPAGGATFMGTVFRTGDALIVTTAYSSNPTVANFIFLEKNEDLATTAVAGLIQIATQAIANAGADNTQAITALTLAGVLANGVYVKKITATNPILNTASGVCTWAVTNTLATADLVVQLIEVATNNIVLADINITAATVTITINSSANIAAGTYKIIGIGI